MKIQLIRNATLKIEYAGRTILVDPMLSPKGSFESFAGIEENPIIDLPIPVKEVLKGVEMVLVTHTHEDHFDNKAKELIHKDLPLFCQPPDEEKIAGIGFNNVAAIHDQIKWKGITITRTSGQHGRGEILNHMGHVSGFILQSDLESTLYIIGDSVFIPEVADTLTQFKPSVVVTNSGGAFIPGFESTLILMDADETMEVAKTLPDSIVIAVHMEALDHCTVTRNDIRALCTKKNISKERLYIPKDGEVIDFRH